MSSKQTVERYGRAWPREMPEPFVEIAMIRKGEARAIAEGRTLFQHYKRLQELLWPTDYHHKWSNLMLKEILANTITAIIGPKDSGKTYVALAKFGLTDYFCFPDCTLVMVSSTDLRGLELRVFGAVKELFERAKGLYPNLAGNLIDSRHAICTDDISEDSVRDMRKGLICIPCLSANGQYLGLGRFVGSKQKRRRLLGDELQFMTESYLDSIANLNTGDFKAVCCGNPLGTGDPLDKIAEPRNGWSSIPEPTKTCVWENRFAGGRTINLVGTDSPNFDYPDTPKHYAEIIGAKEISEIETFYGRNSLQYYSQALGIRKVGLKDNRVLTRELCERFEAFSEVFWKGTTLTRILGLDVGYLGDRCVGVPAEFGEDINGNVVLSFLPHFVVPVRPDPVELPEDQIASFVKSECERLGIVPSNVFFDSTGRGGMGNAFARCWSAYTVGVEFGGAATKRPVANTLSIFDEKLRRIRPKLCSEHFSKFVTELWFMFRYAVESRQVRNLSREVAEELCSRIWGFVRGDKIEVEPKEEQKKRTNKSPDLADAACCALEGARRLGFQIAKVSNPTEESKDNSWKQDLVDRARKLRASYSLTHT